MIGTIKASVGLYCITHGQHSTHINKCGMYIVTASSIKNNSFSITCNASNHNISDNAWCPNTGDLRGRNSMDLFKSRFFAATFLSTSSGLGVIFCKIYMHNNDVSECCVLHDKGI